MPDRTSSASRSKPSPRARAAIAAARSPADDYRSLCLWRRQHAPWLLYSGGTDIFFRLMTAPTAQPLRISDLNIDATALEARVVIDELHRKGFASISRDPKDGSEHVAATDLLRRFARCYVETIDQPL